MKPLAPLAALILAACATAPAPAADTAFFTRVSALCGKAFEGRVETDTPQPSPDFAGKRLLMHVRDCSAEEIRIPFHVGEDRSRTWVVSRTASGLRLKHDHRHADGTPDARTNYGGDTVAPGTSSRQEFPADAESKALFTAQGIPQSNANVWALEVNDGTFVYELARPGRLFRVVFDTTRPVTRPTSPG